MFPGGWRPTASHYFCRLVRGQCRSRRASNWRATQLEKKGLLLRHFTQNIDTLERVAGMSSDVLVEAHGSFGEARCVDCDLDFPSSYIEQHIFAGTLCT